MKKAIKNLLIVLVIVIALFVLTGCGENNNVDEKKSNNPLVGNWKYDGELFAGYNFEYTFNDDGTGKYDAAGTIMEFTYKTQNNKISITYKGDTVSFDTDYSINGDTLTIKDSFGEDTLYKRQ